MLTLSVMIGLLVQDVLGYSPLRAGICFMPFAVAFGSATCWPPGWRPSSLRAG